MGTHVFAFPALTGSGTASIRTGHHIGPVVRYQAIQFRPETLRTDGNHRTRPNVDRTSRGHRLERPGNSVILRNAIRTQSRGYTAGVFLPDAGMYEPATGRLRRRLRSGSGELFRESVPRRHIDQAIPMRQLPPDP